MKIPPQKFLVAGVVLAVVAVALWNVRGGMSKAAMMVEDGMGMGMGDGMGVGLPGHPLAELELTPSLLAERKLAQERDWLKQSTIHDFSFADAYERSGIVSDGRLVPEINAAQYGHGQALAVADVNGDGLIDILYVNQMGGNDLWLNTGNVHFVDRTAASGVAMKDTANIGASFADLDNDGDQDLIVTTVGSGVKLFKNNGKGYFTDVTVRAGLNAVYGDLSGVVAFDYDNDGLTDLFVTNLGKFTSDEVRPGGYLAVSQFASSIFKYPDLAGKPYLFRNRGGMSFVDVSHEVGLPVTPWSGDAVAADLDTDGFTDLYVLSMFGPDLFLHNEGGKRFVDMINETFGKTPWGSMGVATLDWNGDGKLDLYVTDMHSDMHRLVPSDEKSRVPYATFPAQEKSILGNAFYEAKVGGGFREISQKNSTETLLPWGASVGDVNADGHPDLFVTGGMGFRYLYGINSLLLNEGGKDFRDAEFVLGVEPRLRGQFKAEFVFMCPNLPDIPCEGDRTPPITGPLSSRSNAFVDLDADGDLDILTNEDHGHPQVLISDLSQKRDIHFQKVSLRGTESNRDGLGAFVTLVAGDTKYVQVHNGKYGYLAQGAQPLYFGLGAATTTSEIRVKWPSGIEQVVRGPFSANSVVEIVESARSK